MKISHIFRKNKDTKRILLLILSIILGKGVIFYTTPIITEIYDPSSFGELALILSYGNILGVIITFRYELKFLNIIDRKKDIINKFLLTHSFIIFFFALIISIIIFLLFNIHYLFLFVPLVGLLNAIYEQKRMNNVSYKNVSKIALSEISRGSSQGLLPLMAIPFQVFKNIGLIFAEVIARFISIMSLAKKNSFSCLNIKNYIRVLKVSWREMRITGPTKIINVLTNEIIPIFIGFMFNQELLGLFFFSKRLMIVPLSFITKAVSDVISPNISNTFLNKGKQFTRKLTIRIIKKLAIIGVFFALLIFFTIDLIIDFFLDSSYDKVASIIKLSILYYIGILIVKPISNYFNILGVFNMNFKWDVIRLSLVILSFLTCYIFNLEFEKFILVLSISLFLGYMTLLLMICSIKKI